MPLSPPTYDIVEKTAPTGYMVSSDVLKATVTSPTVPAEVTSVDFPPTVPTLSQWGIIGMIGAFGILLVWTGKRRLARKNN